MGKPAKAKADKASFPKKARKGRRMSRLDMDRLRDLSLRRKLEKELAHLIRFGPISSPREYENYNISRIRNKEYVPGGSANATSEER